MDQDGVDQVIQRAIGGDATAIAWIGEHAAGSGDPCAIAMDALLSRDLARLEDARHVATDRRDRQVVEITRAHLAGERSLVDALARDHLVDFPNSYLVAWIAAGAGPSPAAPTA